MLWHEVNTPVMLFMPPATYIKPLDDWMVLQHHLFRDSHDGVIDVIH